MNFSTILVFLFLKGSYENMVNIMRRYGRKSPEIGALREMLTTLAGTLEIASYGNESALQAFDTATNILELNPAEERVRQILVKEQRKLAATAFVKVALAYNQLATAMAGMGELSCQHEWKVGADAILYRFAGAVYYSAGMQLAEGGGNFRAVGLVYMDLGLAMKDLAVSDDAPLGLLSAAKAYAKLASAFTALAGELGAP